MRDGLVNAPEPKATHSILRSTHGILRAMELPVHFCTACRNRGDLANSREELFEYALKCLGARAYSTGDMQLKLQMRAALPAGVDAVIERLKGIGYLDDRRFAEGFAAARVENDGFGRHRLMNDLPRAAGFPGIWRTTRSIARWKVKVKRS